MVETGFLSHYLSGRLLCVQHHIFVKSNVLSASLNKTFPSFHNECLIINILTKVNTACGNSFSDVFLTLLPDGITCLSMQKNKSCSSRAMKGIGLELLIRIGLPPEERYIIIF